MMLVRLRPLAALVMVLALPAASARCEETDLQKLERLLPQLSNPDAMRRHEALEGIKSLPPTPGLGIRMIQGAGEVELPEGDKSHDHPAADLLRHWWNRPNPAFVPEIEKVYDKLEHKGEAREWALRLLSEMSSKTANEALVRLLARPSSRTVKLWFVFVPYSNAKSAPEGLFPGLYGVVESLQDRASILEVILDCANAKHVLLTDAPDFCKRIVDRTGMLVEQYGKAFDVAAANLEYGDLGDSPAAELTELHRYFNELEFLLDLVRFVATPDPAPALRNALALTSVRLRAFAAGSLLARRETVDPATLAKLASNPSGRAHLWAMLEHVGRLDAFPAKYRNQDDLAEADMVHWLEYPTELGCAPSEIALLRKVPDTKEQDRTCYFFKFRGTREDSKWYVGMAGPFPAAGPPTMSAGGTFSMFNELDSKSIEEHIREYMQRE